MSEFSLKILIVEDSLAFALNLERLLEELGYFVCGRVASSSEALQKVHSEQPDLILMDINIKGNLNGIEVGSKIDKLKIPILYITSLYDEQTYALAQESNMIGYLVKPLNTISLKSGIQLAIHKAYSIKKESESTNQLNVDDHICTKHSFFIKKRGVMHKVLIKDIAYIESADNYSMISTTQNSTFTARIPISKMEVMLPEKTFMRIHRKHIINMTKISFFHLHEGKVTINKNLIPVSRKYRQELKNRLSILN